MQRDKHMYAHLREDAGAKHMYAHFCCSMVISFYNPPWVHAFPRHSNRFAHFEKKKVLFCNVWGLGGPPWMSCKTMVGKTLLSNTPYRLVGHMTMIWPPAKVLHTWHNTPIHLHHQHVVGALGKVCVMRMDEREPSGKGESFHNSSAWSVISHIFCAVIIIVLNSRL